MSPPPISPDSRCALHLKVVKRLDGYATRSVSVGMGEYLTATNPHILSTWSLGSCIAIILYDRGRRVGGLAHSMLPRSQGRASSPGKYVDTAICALLRDMMRLDARREHLRSALIGGASIFNFEGDLAIGQKNIEAAREALRESRIPIEFEETGGNRGRSVAFDTVSGEVAVSISKPPIIFKV